MRIKYDGDWPNLCRGNLVVFLDGKKWKFPQYCLSSGGHHDPPRPWSVKEWPKGFPDDQKWRVVDAVNEKLGCGCCGGCE